MIKVRNIENKYGKIIYGDIEHGDLTWQTYDASGTMPKTRREARELEMQIICEDRRDAKILLLDLMCGRCKTMTPKELEAALKVALDRIGVPLYHNGVIRDFCDVFDDIAFALEGVE